MKREQFKYAKNVAASSKPVSSTSSRPSTTSSIRSDTKSQISINPEQLIPTTALHHLKLFENLPAVLIQWRYANAYFKREIQDLQANVDLNFFDRILQLKDLENECNELRITTLKEEYIKELEDILGIEYPNAVTIGREWDNFNETLNLFLDFLANTLDKVFLGDRIVIDVTNFNDYLRSSEEIIAKILTESIGVFEQDDELCAKITELDSIVKEEINEIKEIASILETKSDQINKQMLETSLNNHKAYLSNLEAELLHEI